MQEDYTDITIVLDRSGSMSSVLTDTIGGFNQFVEEQRRQPGRALLSLVQFDDQYETVYEGKLIAEAPLLTTETFVPRGWTALYDAIGKTINNTGHRLARIPEANRPAKVLMVILTDGAENHSREFNSMKIKGMIDHQKTKYQWDFIFVGANQDAILTAASMGILRDKSLTYAANSVGTQRAFASVGNYANVYRAATGGAVGAASAANFTAEDRDLQEDAGVTPNV